MGLTVQATDLRQAFNRKTIFSRISFTLEERQTLLIAGRNGSGKSTLVKILCGVLTPTGGRVTIDGDGARDQFARKARIGMVAPYLQVYEEFSALENLHLSMAMRGYPADAESAGAMLERVVLDPGRKDPVRGFSSGMKQRLKYAMALIHQPSILILDEPMSNLDADGTAIVRSVMNDQRVHGILVVATNDLTDIDRWDTEVNLNDRA